MGDRSPIQVYYYHARGTRNVEVIKKRKELHSETNLSHHGHSVYVRPIAASNPLKVQSFQTGAHCRDDWKGGLSSDSLQSAIMYVESSLQSTECVAPVT